MWKQGQVYLAFVQTPLPYNSIVVEFFFSLRFVSSTLYSAIEVSNKLLFRIAYSTIRELANSIDKSESRVLLVQGMDKFFLQSLTLFQPRNMRV